MQVMNLWNLLALKIELIEKKLSLDVFKVQNTLPKMWHFGILISLSKRNLKHSRCKKGTLVFLFPQKTGDKVPM